LKKELIR